MLVWEAVAEKNTCNTSEGFWKASSEEVTAAGELRPVDSNVGDVQHVNASMCSIARDQPTM
jgi:hypothetical protein